MYARQPSINRSSPESLSDIRLPGNYSGNAFRVESEPPREEPSTPSPTEPEAKDRDVKKEPDSPTKEHASLPTFRLDPGRLFRRGDDGGLGSEDLLLLGMILLLSRGEKDDPLMLLLILLLFVS